MDIKKRYIAALKAATDKTCDLNGDKINKVARLFYECMANGGIVQLFGIKHAEEFVNELNYRAGGIAYYHAYKLGNLVLNGLLKQEEIDTERVYDDVSVVDKFESIYELDDRDMYCLVSYTGNEKILTEIAKRAKSKGQKVVAVVNMNSYSGDLLDYCDEYLDMGSPKEDIALYIDSTPVGQVSSTVTNILAQMITADLYQIFMENKGEAPVLLSANIAGADKHNNSLTDPYGRRIR